MRILHVITEPEAGGAEKIVRWFVASTKDDVDHYAVYLRNPKAIPLGPKEFVLSKKSYLRPDIIFRLWFFLRRNHWQCNIVHTHLTWPLYYVGFYSLLFPCSTLVHTEHNTYNRRRDMIWLRNFERLIYGRYQKIICISDATKVSLVNWLKWESHKSQRFEVIPNGAELFSANNFIPPKGAPVFLSVGSLSVQKNFLSVVFKLAELDDRHWISYLIAGEGPLKQDYQRAIQELKLESKIQLLGYVHDIRSLISQAHIALIPSLWEGFGLVAVEFLSAGLPVIVSDTPGLKDVVENCENAYVIDFNDRHQFQSAVSDILQKFEAGTYNVRASTEHAKQFSIEQMRTRYDLGYVNLKGMQP